MKPLRVAVIAGGPSSEAEVSRSSARAVARGLEQAGHLVRTLELDETLPQSLANSGVDVVFPVAHGAVGEDGSLQGLLEVLRLPYVGSGVLASALAMNKSVARQVFAAHELPVARGMTVARGDGLALARQVLQALGASLFVKPASGGSAIGVTRLEKDATAEATAKALETAWAFDEVAVVEQFAQGREVSCGVLDVGGEPMAALPATEIIVDRFAFYTFEAKYGQGASVHRCPAFVTPGLMQRIQAVAMGAHRALGCRDLSRVDMIVGDGSDASTITLLEVNTLPGFTPTSLFPEAAAVAQIPFEDLVHRLVASAYDRGAPHRNAPLPLP